MIKAPVEICPLCDGYWMENGAAASTGSSANDRRVTRCDCQLRARAQTLLEAARIPRRYEHCELTNYDTDFPGAHPSLADAHFMASNFAKKCDPRGDKGLLIIGKIGTGKTHLAVGHRQGSDSESRDLLPVLRLSRAAEGNSELVQLDGPNYRTGCVFVRCLKPTFSFWTNWEQ